MTELAVPVTSHQPLNNLHVAVLTQTTLEVLAQACT